MTADQATEQKVLRMIRQARQGVSVAYVCRSMSEAVNIVRNFNWPDDAIVSALHGIARIGDAMIRFVGFQGGPQRLFGLDTVVEFDHATWMLMSAEESRDWQLFARGQERFRRQP